MASFDYLILGNSAAAVSAIEGIRSLDASGTIAVVSPENFPAYSTPMISYLLKGKVDEGQMPIRGKSFYADNAVEQILGEPATAIDAAAHTVTVGDAQIGYGKLLVACGSVPADPPVEGLAGQNVFSFLNLTDARAVMAYIEKLRAEHPQSPVRVAVIGSGLIGCKACEGLAAAADEVTMLARSPLILRSIIDEDASRIAERALASAGVDVRLSTQATTFSKEGDRVVQLTLNDGSTIDCDIVMLAAGVKANTGMLANAGAQVERGAVCDKHMQTTLEDVYAAGDVALSRNTLEGMDRVIALWPNAVEQGRVAGLSMAAAATGATGAAANTNADADAGFDGSFPINSIPLCGITICTAGVKDADDGMHQTVETDGSTYTKLVTRNGKLVGYTLVNRPQNAGIYTRMIREGIPIACVDPSLLENVPRLIDLPADIRWGLSEKDGGNVWSCANGSAVCEGGAR